MTPHCHRATRPYRRRGSAPVVRNEHVKLAVLHLVLKGSFDPAWVQPPAHFGNAGPRVKLDRHPVLDFRTRLIGPSNHRHLVSALDEERCQRCQTRRNAAASRRVFEREESDSQDRVCLASGFRLRPVRSMRAVVVRPARLRAPRARTNDESRTSRAYK